MTAPGSVLDDVVAVIEDYLGPAGERFIKRQIIFHLKKKPSELTREDLPKLVEWVKLSLAVLTEDKEMVENCERQILSLGITKGGAA